LFCTFQKYGYTHLSAGDLLRDERKRPGSQYGELIENYIKEGEIVPVEITISLLKRVRKGLFPCWFTLADQAPKQWPYSGRTAFPAA